LQALDKISNVSAIGNNPAEKLLWNVTHTNTDITTGIKLDNK